MSSVSLAESGWPLRLLCLNSVSLALGLFDRTADGLLGGGVSPGVVGLEVSSVCTFPVRFLPLLLVNGGSSSRPLLQHTVLHTMFPAVGLMDSLFISCLDHGVFVMATWS